MIYAAIACSVLLVDGAASTCTCEDARLHNEWCDACQKGFVAGIELRSPRLYRAIDPHGHKIKLKRLSCDTCRSAVATDTYCEKCGIGFVDRKAYFSQLTYQLARGKPLKREQIECNECRKNAQRYGWCDSCSRGMVGPVAIAIRGHYEVATRAYEILTIAIRKAKTCTRCAVAIIANSYCPDCKKRYSQGKVVTPSEPVPPSP